MEEGFLDFGIKLLWWVILRGSVSFLEFITSKQVVTVKYNLCTEFLETLRFKLEIHLSVETGHLCK